MHATLLLKARGEHRLFREKEGSNNNIKARRKVRVYDASFSNKGENSSCFQTRGKEESSSCETKLSIFSMHTHTCELSPYTNTLQVSVASVINPQIVSIESNASTLIFRMVDHIFHVYEEGDVVATEFRLTLGAKSFSEHMALCIMQVIATGESILWFGYLLSGILEGACGGAQRSSYWIALMYLYMVLHVSRSISMTAIPIFFGS